MKNNFLVGAVLGMGLSLLYSSNAKAQGFADDGRVVIGAERITGLFLENWHVESTSTSATIPGAPATTVVSEIDISSTSVALFGSSAGLSLSGDSNLAGGPSATPRIAFDVFVASGFSLGGSIMYVASSGTTKSTQSVNGMPDPDPDGEEDQPSSGLLILAPRVGYGYAVGPSFAIWPRAGVTYSRYGISEEDQDTDPMGQPVTVERTQVLSLIDVTLEFMMAVTPAPNVALLFGPFADIGVGGSVSEESSPDFDTTPDPEQKLTYTSFGLSAGIALVF